jgi:sulfur carrier protein
MVRAHHSGEGGAIKPAGAFGSGAIGDWQACQRLARLDGATRPTYDFRMQLTAHAKARVRIHVNGEPQETTAATLAELVALLGFGGAARIATAVNGDFVPERARATHAIAADDQVEIVAPRQGG